MSQPPYSGPPYGEQPSSGQPSSGQPYPGQPPYQGQPYPGQPYPGQQQPYPGQPGPGQPGPGQPGPGQQYPGQQYPGQPNPDVPTSVPPGYQPTQAYPSGNEYGQPPYGEQPQYGQPQYGQPQYGDPGYGPPGFPGVPPKQKSKALPIVLVSVAVVLVLCVGGSIAIYLAAKNKVNDNKASVTSSTTTEPTADPTDQPTDEPTTPATKNASSVKIVEPKTLGGRPKLTGSQYANVTNQLRNSLAQMPHATNSVGALYGSEGKRNIVVLAATQAPIDDPDTYLNQTFYGAGIGGLKIDNLTSVSTGALGGSAKCGSATAQSINMAICSWADSGSMGMMIWYFKSVGTAKSEFPSLRAEVEHKS